MMAALPHLSGHRERLTVLHQAGEAQRDEVRSAYQRHEFRARVESYLEDMAAAYADSDLVLARAGATTCAELQAAGRPALLVPLALAGGHQEENARAMVAAGAAEMIRQVDLGGPSLADSLARLLDDTRLREGMAEAARRLSRPRAAAIIAERLLELAARRKESE
jgi:UDP-N-acetylglucosamine--N-acetylmuramyl-(pentapeptide) pyrophosphoryl-undecaprenol N-acetylglucosamine transferase